MITDINQLDLNKRYTYADYLSWQFKERVELIEGRIFKMSSPDVKHQQVSRNLFHFLGHFLWKKPCQLFYAPFDVRFNLNGTNTVVQPDICMICDDNMLDEQSCNGAPDLIIEILLKGNNYHDTNDKFNLYEAAGVKEYWIVFPYTQIIVIYKPNEDGKYIGSKPYAPGNTLKSDLLPGLSIEMEQIFE